MKRAPETRCSRRKNRQLPNLPGRLQPSTFGVWALNYCVREGNRWAAQLSPPDPEGNTSLKTKQEKGNAAALSTLSRFNSQNKMQNRHTRQKDKLWPIKNATISRRQFHGKCAMQRKRNRMKLRNRNRIKNGNRPVHLAAAL